MSKQRKGINRLLNKAVSDICSENEDADKEILEAEVESQLVSAKLKWFKSNTTHILVTILLGFGLIFSQTVIAYLDVKKGIAAQSTYVYNLSDQDKINFLELEQEIIFTVLAIEQDLNQQFSEVQFSDNNFMFSSHSFSAAFRVPLSSLSSKSLIGIQYLLKLQGYEVELTGIYNRITRIAFNDFKRRKSLKDFDKIDRATLDALKQPPINDILFISPSKGKVLYNFGMHINPILGEQRKHKGIDIVNKIGTEVVAANEGVVVNARKGWNNGYGNMILIQHPKGYKTRYSHLDEVIVKAGQKVKQGEKIGTIGQTGRIGRPQLEFQIIKNNKTVNPRIYLRTK